MGCQSAKSSIKMDRAILQALNGLVPTISGPLPPELVNLATSLLAQSRNKASNLKAEEEIARTYACANIACERFVRFDIVVTMTWLIYQG